MADGGRHLVARAAATEHTDGGGETREAHRAQTRRDAHHVLLSHPNLDEPIRKAIPDDSDLRGGAEIRVQHDAFRVGLQHLDQDLPQHVPGRNSL